ncbi:MAG: nickel pincer cofactor biosynthesis protein LarB [Deltaproteobacteria bacterium]|nr:nickel pincer cofactor biosynthesis protein LarB [Deltaproteobacteria bacterium]
MDRRALEALLKKVATGKTSPSAALEQLEGFPYAELEDLGVTLDTHRALRTGYPEVVYGEGKSDAQLMAIVGKLLEKETRVLVTRLDEARGQALVERFGGTFHALARCYEREAGAKLRPKGKTVTVVSAGASDAPVAAEAILSARVHGARTEQITDVGVAGIHRLTRHKRGLMEAGVLVVVAGMEGALASVVAGLTGRPVIAVPTSVGYGAAFEGMAALLGMLNSCAPGVSVVNIDNGFGAGRLAAQLARELK